MTEITGKTDDERRAFSDYKRLNYLEANGGMTRQDIDAAMDRIEAMELKEAREWFWKEENAALIPDGLRWVARDNNGITYTKGTRDKALLAAFRASQGGEGEG